MSRFVPALAVAAVLALAGTDAVRAAPRAARGQLRAAYRLRALDDAKSRASLPIPIDTGGPPCNVALPDVPLVIGANFDPSEVDEIATTPSGGIVAWATTIGETGLPGTTRDIVLYREGVVERVREGAAAGDNDQPSLATDRFGYRMAFRGSAGARGETTGNVHLRSARKKDRTPPATGGEGTGGEATDPATGPSEDVETIAITALTETEDEDDAAFGTAWDPTLAAYTRSIEVGSGVKIRVRDARIAFCSTANLDRSGELDPGRNPDHAPQLFVWREHTERFVQLTQIDSDVFTVNRPSISANGGRIAFECDADLTPSAVDPKDPARVGNPSGHRQIYLWDERSGIRQITWGEADSISPRISLDGRFVVFASRGDLIASGNPDGNFEIFVWSDTRDRSRSLRQVTDTTKGHSVLPRPTRSPSVFAFWSTVSPPSGTLEFGAGEAQCGPLPYVYRRGAIVRVGGLTDLENIGRVATSVDDPEVESTVENPVFAGPPCVGASDAKVQFVTNDPRLNAPKADDDLDGDDGSEIEDGDDDVPNLHKVDDREIDASILVFHLARATRFAAKR